MTPTKSALPQGTLDLLILKVICIEAASNRSLIQSLE
ncbi:MAG: hypothetical protein QOI77_2842 [Blastocatellia bacterium]|nr:hypothetical protein [Blastocatellia bacterium]